MLKSVLLAVLCAGVATGAAAQEIVMTRPAALVVADLPPVPTVTPPTPAPVEEEIPFDWGWAAAAEGSYSRGPRAFVNDPPPTPAPLPDWALEEPVRYVAEMCRPGVRPAGEEVEACFTRVEHDVNEARRAGRAGSNDSVTRRECRTETYRSQDGSETSSSYSCTVTNGDPGLLNGLLNRD